MNKKYLIIISSIILIFLSIILILNNKYLGKMKKLNSYQMNMYVETNLNGATTKNEFIILNKKNKAKISKKRYYEGFENKEEYLLKIDTNVLKYKKESEFFKKSLVDNEIYNFNFKLLDEKNIFNKLTLTENEFKTLLPKEYNDIKTGKVDLKIEHNNKYITSITAETNYKIYGQTGNLLYNVDFSNYNKDFNIDIPKYDYNEILDIINDFNKQVSLLCKEKNIPKNEVIDKYIINVRNEIDGFNEIKFNGKNISGEVKIDKYNLIIEDGKLGKK